MWPWWVYVIGWCVFSVPLAVIVGRHLKRSLNDTVDEAQAAIERLKREK